MKSRSRREVIEDIQYAAFWLANEVHSLPPGRAFLALLGEISDEAIDLAVRCTTAGRQITAVLTDALATKLHGDPRSEYRLEWTEEERLDSAFLVVSALHMEALRRRGVLGVRKVPPDPWAPDAVFECRLTGGRLVRRLNAWALMKVFLPKAWRCPPDFVMSEAADRRMERLMSRRKQTTWPWSGASLFPSGPATGHVC
jgi:hypothetical protein